MKNEQNTKVSINSLLVIIDLMVFFMLFIYLDWNFLIVLVISAILGWFISSAWSRGTADQENASRLAAVLDRWWWVVVLLSITPMILILMSAPGHLTASDYIVGELFIGGALAYTGWVDATHDRKLRAALFFLSCAGWVLLSIDMFMFPGDENNAIERIRTLEITTAALLFATLGFAMLAFLWALIETLLTRGKNTSLSQTARQIH